MDYFIKAPDGDRYVDRGSWSDHLRWTEDPEQAVILDEASSHLHAKRIGLPREGYTLVPARAVRAARRLAKAEMRAKMQRIAEALVDAIRARFPGLYATVNTRRDVRVYVRDLLVASFYVEAEKIVGHFGLDRCEGGIEEALLALGRRIRGLHADLGAALVAP